MIRNLEDLRLLADSFNDYLINKGISFTERGFPVFRSEWFIKDCPDYIVPYYHRNSKLINDKKRTMICLFSADIEIYRRYENVFRDLEEYREYMGVICGDLTVTSDMEIEFQNYIMWINQLFTAVLAVNGIKIAMNTRRGSPETKKNFEGMPKNAAYVSSFLGCDVYNEYDFSYIGKILCLQPHLVILYGKRNIFIEEQLETMGILYKTIPDFHTFSKGDRNHGK